MATASATRNEGKTSEKAETPKRERRAAPALHERMKNQLTTAALRGKISTDDLENLQGHIGKLRGLLTE